jgi:uncharacterized protein (TIGR02444 family)
MNNPLWVFSLELYARPGVAEACIEAQDHYAADVNLLLYAAWLARQGFQLDQRQWVDLVASVAAWRQRVVLPLRALRRDWQALAAAGALREAIKMLELEAEKAQHEQVYAWHRRQALRPAQRDGLARALAHLLEAPAGQCGDARRALLGRLHGLLAQITPTGAGVAH